MAGPFYTAWAEDSELTFGPEHVREDVDVFAHTLSQDEGGFATLVLDIQNPQRGLLAPGEPTWLWFSFDPTWEQPEPGQYESEDSEGEISELPSEIDSNSEGGAVPLFFGRLIGLPEDITEDIVRVTFTARPVDFEEQKAALADTLRVSPYDGIWFAPDTRDDPDNVLEFYSKMWHSDPVTHVVTVSDIISGEDGNLVFTGDDVFADSVSVDLDETPTRRVEVTATVNWNQTAFGSVDISQYCAWQAPFQIRSMSGDGVVKNWPKPGGRIGGGWTVDVGSGAERTDSVGLAVWKFEGGVADIGHPFHFRTPEMYGQVMPPWMGAEFVLGAFFPSHNFYMPVMRVRPTLIVRFDADRKRSEKISFAIEADMQAVVTDTGTAETETISVSSAEIVTDVHGEIPIGDVRSSVFFTTPRGTRAIESLLAMARAKLLAKARAARVSFEIPYKDGVTLAVSTRKNARIFDPRIPGGEAVGKIVGFEFSADGDNGTSGCVIHIACAVGKGGTVTPVVGDPDWVDTDYVEDDFQYFTGEFLTPQVDDIVYESIEGQPATDDDGWDFLHDIQPHQVVRATHHTGTVAEQQAAIGSNNESPNDAYTKLNEVPTRIVIDFNPVSGGPFNSVFTFTTSQLKIPRLINLEATDNSASE